MDHQGCDVRFVPKADIDRARLDRIATSQGLISTQSAAPTFKVQASAAEVSNRAKIKRAMSAIVIQPASLYMSELSSFGRTTWPRRAMCVGLTTLSQTRT